VSIHYFEIIADGTDTVDTTDAGVPDTFTSLAVGQRHTCALDEDGGASYLERLLGGI
jgi:hypothetical protein